MEFEIKNIFAGWFRVSFIHNNKSISLVASNKWGNDAPRHFLIVLYDILSIEKGKIGSRYVLLDDEPGANLISFVKTKKGKVFLNISSIIEWYDIDIKLFGKRIPKGLEVKDELINVEIDINKFTESVVKAFEKYSTEEGKELYRENWFGFPEYEYRNLKALCDGTAFSDVI